MTDARATQVAVEEWASITPPQARATQVAVEMWGSASQVGTRAVVTQVAVEMWAALPGAGRPAGGGAWGIMLA